MTIGDKIKKIRTFRNMTQAELGAALGWGDKGANRLAQYETNYRVPRKDLVTEMAKILDVNPLTLHEPTTMDASELMEILFWAWISYRSCSASFSRLIESTSKLLRQLPHFSLPSLISYNSSLPQFGYPYMGFTSVFSKLKFCKLSRTYPYCIKFHSMMYRISCHISA